MTIRHKKLIGRGDTATAGIVPKASDWNAAHGSPEFLIMAVHLFFGTDDPSPLTDPVELGTGTGAAAQWTAYRTLYDFTNVEWLRLDVAAPDQINLLGEYRAQYSADQGITWEYFDGISGPRVSIGYIESPSSGVLSGNWVAVGEAAKADVMVRIVTLLNDQAGDLMPGAISLWGK